MQLIIWNVFDVPLIMNVNTDILDIKLINWALQT